MTHVRARHIAKEGGRSRLVERRVTVDRRVGRCVVSRDPRAERVS